MNLDLKTLVIIRDATRALIDHGSGHTRESFDTINFDIVWEVVNVHAPGVLTRLEEIIAKELRP